jgi:tetratricopeptide (TPR) repeat protein
MLMSEAASTSTDEISLADMLHAALADHRSGRIAEAEIRYRRILAIDPSVPDAWHLLGLLALAAERTDAATLVIGRAISLDPAAALYWYNLGNVFTATEESEPAATCFERALELAPDHEPAARNLGNMRVRLALSPDAVARCRERWGTAADAIFHAADARRRLATGPGYLLIRGWGCGFWGEVNHVAVQLALSEIMGREPVVYWGAEVRYRASGIENAWEAYFDPVSRVEIEDLEAAGQYFPGHWASEGLRSTRLQPMQEPAQANPYGIPGLAGLNREEPTVVADGYHELGDVIAWSAPAHPYASLPSKAVAQQIFARRIHLRPDLRRRVDAGVFAHFTRRPVMAVHCRAQSRFKQMESLENKSLTTNDYFPSVDAFLARFPAGAVFLLSDAQLTVDLFAERYGDRLIVLPRQRLASDDQVDLGLDHARDGHALAVEVLEDAYLAAACDYFVGDGASGVSCSIAVLKDWPEGRIRLLRRNVFQERRGGLYPG